VSHECQFDLPDPYFHAPISAPISHVDPREVFLVMTRRDESVPTYLQQQLHEALGSPESISLPTGHYSAVLYLPVILESGRRFLAQRFRAIDANAHNAGDAVQSALRTEFAALRQAE
jgi:hypothetical protein